jgi:hypothetical protein
MRQGSNGRRPRGRPQRKQHGGAPRHGNFDSSGPEGRIRGNAHQVYEKYIGLARDATSFGDRVAAETYYQHAEHYYRIVNARNDAKPNGDGQSSRRGGNGPLEAAGEAAPGPGDTGEQPKPAALNGEPPQEASQAQDRPAQDRPAQDRPAQDRPAQDRPAGQGERRRRPRQAKAPEPQPAPQPDTKPEAQPREDSDSAET